MFFLGIRAANHPGRAAPWDTPCQDFRVFLERQGCGSSCEIHNAILMRRSRIPHAMTLRLSLGVRGANHPVRCTTPYSVSPEFSIHSLLVFDSGQGLKSSRFDSIWCPIRFSFGFRIVFHPFPISRLGFRFAFCRFPIRLPVGF